MLERRQRDPYSEGGMYAPENMVLREKHPVNRGRPAQRCIGRPRKLYSRFDYVAPILDGMEMLFHRAGWKAVAWDNGEQAYVQPTPPPRKLDTVSHLYALGLGPAPPAEPQGPLCSNCLTTNPHDFSPTTDKSHLVCKCGAVSSAIHISQAREKNCAKEEDKTTHADTPFDSKTDRFDHPAKNCTELRKEREREAMGSRVSRRTREKNGLGWVQEHVARAAVQADRQRQEMDIKEQNKGQRIQVELDRLFTPLEPMADPIKRFCRMEADRAWRQAVRHERICMAKNQCQLRVKEKGPAVIADATLSVSLHALLNGDVVLDGVSHGAILTLANKLTAINANKGNSCALRAVRIVVSALLSHSGPEPIASCPLPGSQSSPISSVESSGSLSDLCRAGPSTLSRNDSSLSDVPEGSEAIQLRDSIQAVHKHLGTVLTNGMRNGALRAIQDPVFRGALAAAREDEASALHALSSNGVSFAILEAVGRASETATGGSSSPRTVPPRTLSALGGASQLSAAVLQIQPMLPRTACVTPIVESDGLFS